MHVSLHIEGDLTEIARVLTAFSGSGATVEPAIQAKSAADDEPVKPARQAKAKPAKPILPQEPEASEAPETPAEDFKTEDAKAPFSDSKTVTLEHLIERTTQVSMKSADHESRLKKALGKYGVTNLEDLEKTDYETFHNDLEMINVAQIIRKAIAGNQDLSDAASEMLQKYFKGYTLSNIPSDRYQELKSRFEELV